MKGIEVNRETKIVVMGVAICYTAAAIKKMYTLKKIREELKTQSSEEIIRIRTAASIIQERMKNGGYAGRLSLDTIMTDFEFERLIQDQGF